jgi:hypothetical protein
MSDTTAPRPDPTATRMAHAVAQVFSPVVVFVATLVCVAIGAADTVWLGLRDASVAVLFFAAAPYAMVALGVRRGRFSDMHMRRRADRPVVLTIALVSMAVGWWVLRLLGASGELRGLIAAILVMALVALLVTLAWKISLHGATSGLAVAALVITFGRPLLLGGLAVVAVGWARVSMGDHTVPQFVAGVALGVLAAVLVMPAVAAG